MSNSDPGAGQPGAGQPSQILCPNCHGGNPPDATTCMWCGQPLSQARATPGPQPTMPMNRPLPPQQPPTQQYQQQYPQQPPIYPGQYPPPGAYPPAANVQVKKGGKPVWLFVVLGLLALCILIVVVFAVLANSAGKSLVNTINQAGTQIALTATAIDKNLSASADATDTAIALNSAGTEASVNATSTALAGEASSQPTNTAEASTSGENPTATTGSSSGNTTGTAGGIGSSAETDGLKITLNGVRRDAGNSIFKPDAGNEYLIVNLTFENTTTDTKTVSSLLSFSVKDDTGRNYTITFGPQVQGSADGTVEPGGKLRGEAVFEVPKDATGLVFTYTPFLIGSSVSFKLDK